MIIILEGMDNTGKSTLANQLREVFTDTVMVHSTKPPLSVKTPFDWEMRYYFNTAVMFSENPLNTILDRFHLGTYVYGKRYRNYTDDEVTQLFDLTEGALLSGDQPVYLFTLIDTGSNLVSRDDGLSFEQTAPDYDITREAFIKAHDKSSLNKLLIDVSANGGMKNNLNTVLEFIDGK